MGLTQNQRDYETASRLGNVPGVAPLTIIGHSDAVDASMKFLHHEHDNADLDVDTVYDTPTVLKVSSSDAADVLTSGTGAWTVRIAGIDSAGAAATEDVNLNGVTEVATSTVWKVIHSVTVIAAGTTGSNEGVLYVGDGTVTAGVPATVNMSVEIGTNVSRAAIYCVPTGKKLVLHQILIFSGDTSKDLEFQFLQLVAATGLWLEAFDIHTTQSEADFAVESYPPLVAGDIVAVKCKVDTGTAAITIAISGDLVDV